MRVGSHSLKVWRRHCQHSCGTGHLLADGYSQPVAALHRPMGKRMPGRFFAALQAGNVEEQEMFRTFNMGIGMVAVIDATDADAALSHLSNACVLGHVVEGEGVQF